MKILQCVVFYVPIRVGGIEIYVKGLSEYLVSKGHDVKIVVPCYPGEKDYAPNENGIPVLSYPEFVNTSRSQFSGTAPSKGLPGFKEILRSEMPDIVHFHQLTSSNGMSIAHLKIAKELKLKIVFTNHLAGLLCQTGKLRFKGVVPCNGKINHVKCAICNGFQNDDSYTVTNNKALRLRIKTILPNLFKLVQGYREAKSRLYKTKQVLELSDRVIVISNWFYEVLKRNNLNTNKVVVIKQGLPLRLFNYKSNFTPHLKLVFIGRVFPEKGLHILLNAIQKLDTSKYSIDIYGQNDGESYVTFCKALCGTRENIKWHGVIENNKVVEVISAYDLLIIPSIVAEMAPLIIQEAFAANTPIIASDCLGNAEEIEHMENGLLYSSDKPNELADVINKLINNPEILSKLKKNLTKPNSFVSVGQRIEYEYSQILNN